MLEIELICRDCGEELEAEENGEGQVEVKLCENCKQRLSLEGPAE